MPLCAELAVKIPAAKSSAASWKSVICVLGIAIVKFVALVRIPRLSTTNCGTCVTLPYVSAAIPLLTIVELIDTFELPSKLTVPVTSPLSAISLAVLNLPSREAVITLALKLPEPSLITNLFDTLLLVAFVATVNVSVCASVVTTIPLLAAIANESDAVFATMLL